MTCSIIPVIHKSKEIIKNTPDTIKLGNLGTIPVFIYSITTGTPSNKEHIKDKIPNILKKNPGLYYLNKIAIVFNTLNPSL